MEMNHPFVIMDEKPSDTMGRARAILSVMQALTCMDQPGVITGTEKYGIHVILDAADFLIAKAQQGIKTKKATDSVPLFCPEDLAVPVTSEAEERRMGA